MGPQRIIDFLTFIEYKYNTGHFGPKILCTVFQSNHQEYLSSSHMINDFR